MGRRVYGKMKINYIKIKLRSNIMRIIQLLLTKVGPTIPSSRGEDRPGWQRIIRPCHLANTLSFYASNYSCHQSGDLNMEMRDMKYKSM